MSTNTLPSRAEDFPARYVEVVKRAQRAERAELADALEGFWIGAWCGEGDGEAEVIAKTRGSIRFLPLEPREPGAACVHRGKPGVDVATLARAY